MDSLKYSIDSPCEGYHAEIVYPDPFLLTDLYESVMANQNKALGKDYCTEDIDLYSDRLHKLTDYLDSIGACSKSYRIEYSRGCVTVLVKDGVELKCL